MYYIVLHITFIVESSFIISESSLYVNKFIKFCKLWDGQEGYGWKGMIQWKVLLFQIGLMVKEKRKQCPGKTKEFQSKLAQIWTFKD